MSRKEGEGELASIKDNVDASVRWLKDNKDSLQQLETARAI